MLPFAVCFRLRLENRDDNVSVDRQRPFYEDDTGRRSQTGQIANNTDIGLMFIVGSPSGVRATRDRMYLVLILVKFHQ